MERPLNVLLLEDVDSDVRILESELKRAGFGVNITKVETSEALDAGMSDEFDLIIADCSLPRFSAPETFAMIRDRGLEVPLIVVTDAASEDLIVECMRAGAADFLLRDRLARLGQAVSGAIAASKDRADLKREARAVLRRNVILDSVGHAIVALLTDPDWKSALHRELASLGAAAEVHSVSVFRISPTSDAPLDKQGRETPDWGDLDALGDYRLDLAPIVEDCLSSEWNELLASGEVLARAVSELPDPERAHLDDRCIKSVLVAPVTAGDELWGALMFGETSAPREWAAPEIGALEAAARILGVVVLRERVAHALRKSEETNRAILLSIPDLLFRLGADGVIIGHKAIRAGEHVIPAGSLGGISFGVIAGDAAAGIEQLIADVLNTGRQFVAEEARLSFDSGRLYELRIVQAGNTEVLAIARDITDRHRSEQRTLALNAATHVLAESETVPEMISRMLGVLGSHLGFDTATYWAVDTELNSLVFAEMWHRDSAVTGSFEAAAREISMLPGEGVAGRVWDTRGSTWVENVSLDNGFLLAAGAEQAQLESALAFAVSAGSTIHGVIKLLSRAQRKPDPNLVRAAESLGNQIGRFIERKRHESQVIESEARFRNMADMAPVFVWVSDIAGKCTFVNRSWLDFTGTTIDESLDSGWLEYIHPDDRSRSLVSYGDAFEDRQGYQLEHRVLRHDGEYRWVLNTGVPRFGANGEFVGFIGSGIDITDKMLVEAELRTETSFIETLLDTIDIGIVACNENGELTLLNRATRELLGISNALVTQDDWVKAAKFHESGLMEAPRDDRDPLNRALYGEVLRCIEMTSLADPKNPKVLVVSGQRIAGPGGETTGAVIALRDVTTERLLEGQFRQAHKMEAVGRLAGGVAHDFNNILTVITGYGEMLRQRFDESDQPQPFIDEILGASARAASLTRQLLAFSRKQLLQPRAVALNALVKNLHKLLQRLIGEDVELRIKLDPTTGTIFADPGQIEQVVINLVVNARDAMPEGGTLSIETSTMELGQTSVEGFGEIRQGPYHTVSVTDTGCGMTPDTMSHIYEPFFTTKGADRGTGLGLSTVYGIVRQSNGVIFATSEPGIGSVFRICLPVHAATEPSAHDVDQASLPVSRGETILLVEDDQAVRTLVSGVLIAEGYVVVESQNGQEALVMINSRPNEFDLVLSDVVMPKMSGRELARRIKSLWPGLRILFMSGYTHDVLSAEERENPGVFILEKPFNRIDLAVAVRHALDKSPDPGLPIGQIRS